MSETQHFREAERLLKKANAVDRDDARTVVAMAQVHPTLALAAATAEAGGLTKGTSLGPTVWAKAVAS
ncbi:hypothetical protein [Actinopolymorpha alba]|uniref:hypothetical protein n=1 Tax=Actinopolymorpha alba TaxID=533267 RepID=UPI00036C5178|nr:hypothetical protein [Actinopolymorpha alba]